MPNHAHRIRSGTSSQYFASASRRFALIAELLHRSWDTMKRARLLVSAALLMTACFVMRRWRPRRAGAAAGPQSRHRRPRIPARDRCDARKAGAWRVDQLAADLRRHRLQPAESDQQAERRATEARVVVGNAGGSASADAARSRRRHVSADARRRRASGRRHQRRLPVGVPRHRLQEKATATCAPRRRAISRSTPTRST